MGGVGAAIGAILIFLIVIALVFWTLLVITAVSFLIPWIHDPAHVADAVLEWLQARTDGWLTARLIAQVGAVIGLILGVRYGLAAPDDAEHHTKLPGSNGVSPAPTSQNTAAK